MAALAKLRSVHAARKIVGITAWDYPTGLIAETAGIDLVLVGDSLGIVALGHEDTKSVTLEEMIHHTRAVTRAAKSGFVLADLPLGSYEKSTEHAINSAIRLIKEGHAHGVKLEGGSEMGPTIEAITKAGVAVFGHMGMTPQRNINDYFSDSYKTSPESTRKAEGTYSKIKEDALQVQRAGAVAVLLEAVPTSVSEEITKALRIPTIGIGSGAVCSGQMILQSEALGYQTALFPQWQKRYTNTSEESVKALREYASDVVVGRFPGKEHETSEG